MEPPGSKSLAEKVTGAGFEQGARSEYVGVPVAAWNCSMLAEYR